MIITKSGQVTFGLGKLILLSLVLTDKCCLILKAYTGGAAMGLQLQ